MGTTWFHVRAVDVPAASREAGEMASTDPGDVPLAVLPRPGRRVCGNSGRTARPAVPAVAGRCGRRGGGRSDRDPAGLGAGRVAVGPVPARTAPGVRAEPPGAAAGHPVGRHARRDLAGRRAQPAQDAERAAVRATVHADPPGSPFIGWDEPRLRAGKQPTYGLPPIRLTTSSRSMPCRSANFSSCWNSTSYVRGGAGDLG
jgi:hypothetical protein